LRRTYQKVMDAIVVSASGRSFFDGCHKHRIIPGYAGGTYNVENVVYVTQREHSIIHFLRWKLYGDLRDKRAFKMIGTGPSGLSHQDRVDHGRECAENKIGIHGADEATRTEWQGRGRATQVVKAKLGEKNWVYWSSEEGRRERSRLGGKSSHTKNQLFIEQQCSFTDKDKASAASRKSAKKPVTDGRGTLRKFHTEDQVIMFLKENPTWRRGCPTRKEKLALVR
jgi:hypothetical protein